jgi:hypothetical protein
MANIKQLRGGDIRGVNIDNLDNPDNPYWKEQTEEAALILDGALSEVELYTFYSTLPDDQTAMDTFRAICQKIKECEK